MQGFHACENPCMETNPQVKQRPMAEIRRLVEEDNPRFDDLAAVAQKMADLA